MTEYDYGKPIPTASGGKGRGKKKGGRTDVLRKMPANASFFFPGTTVHVLAMSWRKMQTTEGLASKFTARTVTEDGVKGVRVWRIE